MRIATRYALAAGISAIGAVLTVALAPLLAPMRLFFLWCSVLVTAIVAGTGPALLSILLSLVVAVYVIFGVPRAFAVYSLLDAGRLALFALFAMGLSFGVGMRRRAEERAEKLSAQVRTSELRYRTLVEANPVPQAVWTATADGSIRWSDSWATITGRSLEKLNADGMRAAVHPDDAPRLLERWRNAVETRSLFDDEFRVCVASGRYRWFAIRGVPVVDAGRVLEWAGIVADIHDRRYHEETSAFINHASEVLASSLDYEQTMRNLARLCVPQLGDWCAIDIGEGAGYQRLVIEHADPSRVEPIQALDRIQRASPEIDPIVAVLRSGRASFVDSANDDLMARLTDSPERLEAAKSLALRSWIIAPMIARGRTLGALTVVWSETDRHYSGEDVPLIEELARRAAIAIDNARLYEAAEAANRAKDEFLATLSHELRTPLTAITGWADMLSIGITDPDTLRTAIDTILSSARIQRELIDDLLDLSRVVAGTLHLNVGDVDLRAMAEEVVVAARPASEAKHLAIRVTGAKSVIVRGDERRLRQIAWNLVNNSVKFTETGSVTVDVSVREAMARLEVTDTGRGIEPAFLPHVWDRFRQADSSTSRQHGGLGLGLAVVRHLAELHGGTVEAHSDGPGKGARFAVEIPLSRVTNAGLTSEEGAPRLAVPASAARE